MNFAATLPDVLRDDARGHAAPVSAGGAAIATAHPDATLAAAHMLAAGGNAADAAAAAAWALAVCEPSASGLGGQAIALTHFAGATRVLDGHSRAPCGLDPRRLTKRRQRSGHAACTIPSMPATVDALHRRHGVLDRQTVMGPAIQLAHAGYRLSRLQARLIGWTAPALRESGVGECFLEAGVAKRAGACVRQPALARTLQRLSDAGVRDFYEGQIAAAIAADMAASGGLVTLQDLASFQPPRETAPLSFGYRGCRVDTAAPPAGGLHLAVALRVLEQLAGADSADEESWLAAIAFATFAAFHDRDAEPVTPESWTPAAMAQHLAGARISGAIQAAARALHAPPGENAAADEEPGDTTHLSIADREGNAVALTLSIQSVFGAKVATPRLGFFYNNYLRTCPRRAHPQQLASGCQPRSNAVPAMFWPQGAHAPRLVLGSAGSRRIVSSVLQVASRVLDRDMPLEQAVAAPRIHALLSRKLWIEKPAAGATLIARLRPQFPEVITKSRHSYAMAAVHAVGWDAQGRAEAAADPRRDGDIHVEHRHD